MSDDSSIRITYLANRGNHERGMATAEPLRLQIERYLARNAMPPVRWKYVTNQRAALAVDTDGPPPRLMLIEFSTPDQRLDFCKLAQHRFPATKIVGIGYQRPNTPTAMHDFLELPIEAQQVEPLLSDIFTNDDGHKLFAGRFSLNLYRTVFTPTGQHHITPKATALLHLFMTHANQVLSRSEIMREVWQTDYLEDTRTLDVHIRWLRECIEVDPSEPRHLVTVRGQGYRFKPD
ncbi:MAG: winged helix-turn-helix domain-containing protein [Anaerolineales bacterium]|nr:winged helix-turn-helix domain-containing protein [Anaerolineales bacterium]